MNTVTLQRETVHWCEVAQAHKVVWRNSGQAEKNWKIG